MGIKGLWQALREYVDDGHLSQFRGQRVAVDMYVWLHRCLHRAVRINNDAVIAYLDRKYAGVGDDGAMTGGTPELSSTYSTTMNAAVPVLPLPSVDDVLVLDDQFIALVLDKVAALQRFGVTPVCVFDGTEMPMKGNTDEERQRRRSEAYAEAMQRLEHLYCEERRRHSAWVREGDGSSTGPVRVRLPQTSRLYEEAVQLMEKAVDISTELAHVVLQVLKEERNVECIVAPYEADAQLAHLCRVGYVAAAASEDSDLIAYYCPCVISKLDTFSGKCEVLQPPICAPQFFHAMAATAAAYNGANGTRGVGGGGGQAVHTRLRAAAAQPLQSSPQSPSGGSSEGSAEELAKGGAAVATAASFTYESFLLGCIMSGCDYVANLRNIGIKKAFKLVSRASSLRQVFVTLECEYGFPAEELAAYRRRLLESFYCFAHHLVYCPLQQEIVPYHPLPTVADSSGAGSTAALKTDLVGVRWDAQTAQDVCVRCLSDPCTLRLYRGTYQSCLTRYLQRTRRGQTSLKAYGGFEGLSSGKVVMQLGGHQAVQSGARNAVGVKRERDEGAAPHAGFVGALQKREEGHGFVGASRKDGEVVVVRSRYFLCRGRTAVCERWSASDEEAEADRASDDAHDGSLQYVQESDGLGKDGSAENAVRTDAALSPAVAMPPTPMTTDSTSSPSTTGTSAATLLAGREQAAHAARESPEDGVAPSTCAGPFGYRQCNRSHSVFESCFLGQQWNRDDGPLTSASSPNTLAPISASTADEVGTEHEKGSRRIDSMPSSPSGSYVPRAFRPPRSTAAAPSAISNPPATMLRSRTLNTGATATVVDGGKPTRDSAADATVASSSPSLASQRAAARLAIFDQMTLKKA